MSSNYNGQSTENQPDFSEFSTVTPNTSNADSATLMAVLFSIDQADMIALEYAGINGGVTVEELMPVLGLSNPATSIRLRKLSESQFKGIDVELLRRVREGDNGAYLHYLNGVTLEVIQSVMAKRGFSYENYWARKKKRVHTVDNEYVDANALDTKNIQEQEAVETHVCESQQSELCPGSWRTDAVINEHRSMEQVHTAGSPELPRQNEVIEPTESPVETKSDADTTTNASGATEKLSEDIVDSLCDPLILQKSVALLLQEIVSVKQECSNLRRENVNFKEELAKTKSHLAELEQKLKEKNKNELQATLDQLLILNKTQNGNGKV